MKVYKELKREIGFEDYLEYVKRAPSRLFLTCVQVTMVCLRSWVGILRQVGQRSVLIVGLVRSQLSMFFLNVHRMIPRLIFGLFEEGPSSECVSSLSSWLHFQ